MIYLPAARPSITTHRRLTAEVLAHERQIVEIYPKTKIDFTSFLAGCRLSTRSYLTPSSDLKIFQRQWLLVVHYVFRPRRRYLDQRYARALFGVNFEPEPFVRPTVEVSDAAGGRCDR